MGRFVQSAKLLQLAAVLMVATVLAGCSYTQTVGSQTDSQLPALTTAQPHPAQRAAALPTPRERSSGPSSPSLRSAQSKDVAPEQLLPTFVPTAIQLISEIAIQPTIQPTVQPSIPSPLIAPGLDLLAGPVDLPLELQIPALKVNAPILGVGINSQHVMDSPTGPLTDPVWQKAFWYRGSGVPGDSGTAAFAGHVNDTRGRPAVFAHLMNLRPGDLIVVHNSQSGLDIDFSVTRLVIYSRQQAGDPAILAQVYGPGPVAGKGPQPAVDGLSHLTLITCIGDFVGGSFDHRLVVFATRRD